LRKIPGLHPFSDRSTTAPNGTHCYGVIPDHIADEIGIRAGEIRLLNGFENLRNTGFGLAHIRAKDSRRKTIENLGFRSIDQMVFQACSGYDTIHQGKDGKQLLVKAHLTSSMSQVMLEVVIEWHDERGFWHVITALPTAVVREPQLWPKI